MATTVPASAIGVGLTTTLPDGNESAERRRRLRVVVAARCSTRAPVRATTRFTMLRKAIRPPGSTVRPPRSSAPGATRRAPGCRSISGWPTRPAWRVSRADSTPSSTAPSITCSWATKPSMSTLRAGAAPGHQTRRAVVHVRVQPAQGQRPAVGGHTRRQLRASARGRRMAHRLPAWHHVPGSVRPRDVRRHERDPWRAAGRGGGKDAAGEAPAGGSWSAAPRRPGALSGVVVVATRLD